MTAEQTDREFLQGLIDEAVAAHAGAIDVWVSFPPGVYRLDAPLVLPQHARIRGHGALLEPTGPWPAIRGTGR